MSKRMPIFYSAMLLTGANLLLRMAGTAFQVYLSGRIGAAGIGLLQLTLSVGSLATVAGMGGIRTTTMYLTSEELGRSTSPNTVRILSGCFFYSILFSSITAILLIRFSRQISAGWIGDIRAAPALQLIAAFLPVVCLTGVLTGYFTAEGRIAVLAAVEGSEQLCFIGITLALLSRWGGTAPDRSCLCVVLGSSLSSSLALAVLTVLLIQEKRKTGPKVPIKARILQSALPLAAADNLKSGITTAENIMVPPRLARNPYIQNPLAAFGMISGMIFPVIMFPAAILFGLTELLIPEFSRCRAAGNMLRIRYLTVRCLRITLIYGMIAGGMLFLLSAPLCTLLYQSRQAASHMECFALLIPMLYCDLVTDAMVKGLGQQKICVRYNILTSGLDLLFLYFLLPRYGLSGYYWSFLGTHLLNFCLSVRRLLRTTQLSAHPDLVVLCVASMLFSLIFAQMVTPPLLRSGAFLIIFFCLLMLFRILTYRDLMWIRGLIYKK